MSQLHIWEIFAHSLNFSSPLENIKKVPLSNLALIDQCMRLRYLVLNFEKLQCNVLKTYFCVHPVY